MSGQSAATGTAVYRLGLVVVMVFVFLIGGAAGYVAKAPAPGATRYVYVVSHQPDAAAADACIRSDGRKAC